MSKLDAVAGVWGRSPRYKKKNKENISVKIRFQNLYFSPHFLLTSISIYIEIKKNNTWGYFVRSYFDQGFICPPWLGVILSGVILSGLFCPELFCPGLFCPRAMSMKQFHTCTISKQQMVVEKRHRDLEEMCDLQCGREPDADRILWFLNASLHFTDNIYNFFLQSGMRKMKNVTGSELLVANRIDVMQSANIKTRPSTKRAHYTVTLTPFAHGVRSVTVKTAVELPVKKVHGHF